MKEWAKNNNLDLNFKEICSNPEAKKIILKDLDQQAKTGGLKGFEKVLLTIILYIKNFCLI